MEIKESLDTKPKLENDQPAWYQLLHYTKLEEKEFYNLLNEVQNDLKEISVGGADAVKHIISLLMYFQEKKVININIDEYIGYAKKNLKKIYENLSSDRLKEINDYLYYSCKEHEHTFGLPNSIGLGLYSKDNESFKKFIEKCKEIRKDVLQSKNQKEDKDVIRAKTK